MMDKSSESNGPRPRLDLIDGIRGMFLGIALGTMIVIGRRSRQREA